MRGDSLKTMHFHLAALCAYPQLELSRSGSSFFSLLLLLLLLGAKLPLMEVESFGLLNNIFPFPSILDTGYPVFNLHLANILFDVILPSVLGSSL
jgi:hypothetical protein